MRIKAAIEGCPLFWPHIRFLLLFTILFLTRYRFFSGPPFKKADCARIIGPLYPLFMNLNALGPFDGLPQTLCFAKTDHTSLRSMS